MPLSPPFALTVDGGAFGFSPSVSATGVSSSFALTERTSCA